MSDFDTVFNHFKDNTKPMCELMGCPEVVEDFMVDVEINRQSFKSFYEAGQKSKQAEVDELRKNFNNALKTIEIQQRFLDDADGANKILTSQASDLQKRIDDLITSIDWHIEDCELWLSMNKNDSWKGGQLEILKAIKKRFSK